MLAFISAAPLIHGARLPFSRAVLSTPPRTLTPRVATSMALDPSFLHHTLHLSLATDAFHGINQFLADAAAVTADFATTASEAAKHATSSAGDAAQHAASNAGDAAKSIASTAGEAAQNAASTAGAAAGTASEAVVQSKKTGLWGNFVGLVESAIVSLHGVLEGAGVPGAYGFSIIFFTVIVKALTFPLNKKQMESTMRMQALAPRLKKIQTDYKENPSVMNQMIAQLYKEEKINPLAGCLPVFAQIPVWIALYRSVLNLAADDLLKESFLWLPSLQGPVSKTGQGLNTWLFPLVDGAPPIGWHDALCYLVLPVALVATQYYTTKLLQPPTQDPQQQQANNFLKFMPLLIGWFSLNVPSGLGVYWVTNNLLSTLQTMYIRSTFPSAGNSASDDASTSVIDTDSEEVMQSRSLDIADGFRNNGGSSTASKSSKASKSKKRRKRR